MTLQFLRGKRTAAPAHNTANAANASDNASPRGLRVEGVQYNYPEAEILKGVTFALPYGQLVSVLGANGVGKSTLFRCILGLNKDYTGSIFFDDAEVRTLNNQQIAQRVAYIPQSHYLSFQYSVFDMVLMGTTSGLSLTGSPGKAEHARAQAAIDMVGIGRLQARTFQKISGGEQQLVLLARAIAQAAKIIIMDEPTANLDYGNQIKVLNCMRKLADAGYLILQSTHNPEQAYLFSDRILAFAEGKLLADGKPSEILTTETVNCMYSEGSGQRFAVESLHGDTVRVCIPCEFA